MNEEIKVNKANKSITFINNGIAFSQFGVADEILDLITNLQKENKRLKEINKEQANHLISKDNLSYEDYKLRCEKSLKALHNSKEYKVMKELEFNKNMSILIKLDKLLQGSDKDE